MKKILLLISLFIILLPCVALADGAEASYGYVDGNTVYAGISLDNPQSGSNVYVGIYTSEGKLKSLKSYPVTSTSYSIDMKIDGYSSETGDVIRMFCLGDDIAPLAETVSHNMKSLRLSGIITGTSVIGQAVATDEVEFMCTYAGGDPAWELIVENASNVIIKHGIANINDYFGACVDVYVDEIKENLYKITGISFDEDYSIVDLEKGSIDTLTSSELNYYESDTAVKTTCLNLDDADVYVNNEYSDINDIQSLGDDTEIRLIENNGDGKYDLIIAKEYKYGIIDRVEPEENIITTIDGVTFTFDFEDEVISNVILDRYGNAVKLDDFSEGDVIAFISESNRKTDFEWIEIINLKNNYVSGVVTEINTSINTVYIDNVKYKLVSGMDTPYVGDDGIYYLAKSGKIFYYKKAPLNYGYILDMARVTTAFMDGWQFKILTKEGNIEIYDAKNVFSVSSDDEGGLISVNSRTSDWSDLGNLNVLESKSFNEEMDSRVVIYELNGKNQITQIESCASEEFTDANCVKDFLILGSKILEPETVVFNIADSDIDDSYATDAHCLVNGNSYSGIVTMNDSGKYDCVVIVSGECDYEKPVYTYSEPIYGYAYASGIVSTAFESRWQIKVLSESYPNLTLDFADNFTVNGTSYSNSERSIPVLEDLNSDVYSGEERIVSYVLENGKYISELDFVSAESFTDAVYSTDKLGDAVLSDKTKVYDIYGEVMLTNAFMAGEAYSGCAIVDSNGAYTHVFVTSGELDYTDITLTPKYGYILEMAKVDSAFSQDWMFKILTQDGDIVIYDSRDNIEVSSEFGSDEYSMVYTKTADWDDMGFLACLENKAFDEDVSNRIVRYTLLTDGKIANINSVNSTAIGSDNIGEKYIKNESVLGNYALCDDIVVFDVSCTDSDDAAVTAFIDKSEYVGWLAINDGGEYDAFVITDWDIYMDLSQDIAIVDSVNTITYNNDDMWLIKYYSAGSDELKEVTVTQETIAKYSDSIEEIVYNIDKGSMMMFTDDGNEIALAATLISTANNSYSLDDAAYILNEEAVEAINAEGNLQLVASYIHNITRVSAGTIITYGANGNLLPVRSSVNGYTYNYRTANKISIVVGDWMCADTIDIYDPYTDEATFFIAIIEDGVASDIMTYSTRKIVSTQTTVSAVYGLIIAYATGSGIDSDNALRIMTTGGKFLEYNMKSSIKIDGESMDSSDAIKYLKEKSTVSSDEESNVLVIPVIYQVSGSEFTSILTLSPDVKKTSLIYSGDEYAFIDGTSTKFTMASSGINAAEVFVVPIDIEIYDEYLNETVDYFSTNKEYTVAAYELTGTNAKIVVCYLGAEILASTPVYMIDSINDATNNGELVKKLTYRNISKAIDGYAETIFSSDDPELLAKFEDLSSGDLIKFVTEEGVISDVKKVFVDGMLSNETGSFSVDGYHIIDKGDTTIDYYQVIYGTIYNQDNDAKQISVIPAIYDGTELDEGSAVVLTQESDNIPFHKYNSNTSAFEASSSSATKKYMEFKDTDEQRKLASQAVVVVMNGKAIGVYLINE